MARGRIVSKTVADDAALNRLSLEAEWLFLRTIPHLDRDGLIDGRPALLWATVAPLRVTVMDRTPALIDEWVQQGLVLRYEGTDGPILFFRGFRRHQANMPYGNELASRYPPPPGWHRSKVGMVPDDPDLARSLAEGLDPRSKYRAALLKAATVREEVARESRGDGDAVASDSRGVGKGTTRSSRGGRDEDQDHQQDQDQHQVFDDDGLTATRKADDDGGLLRAWCRDMTADYLPDWLGSTERIDASGARELVALSTWLWAWKSLHGDGSVAERYRSGHARQEFRRRHRDLFEGVGNVPGRIIRQALDLGNPYPLDEEARADLREAVMVYGDPAAILFGGGDDE